MSTNIPSRDQKILCTRSGNRCAMPDCHRVLVANANKNDKESLVAQMAHIKGEKSTAPRFDSTMTDEQRNSYGNLILVCDNCHKIIDDQYHTYTVEKLHNIKLTHEIWILDSTEKEVINVSFAELSVVTKYLVSGQHNPAESYVLIPPKDKIRKNGLSQKTEHLITMGMTQVKQVAQFIERSPDIDFADRLKDGFITEYERLKNTENLVGDELFNELLDFASGGVTDFKQKAAGLAVLVYLFEKCEVFEK